MDDHSTSKLFRGLAELGGLVARAERACEHTHNLVRQQHDIVAAFQGIVDVETRQKEQVETRAGRLPSPPGCWAEIHGNLPDCFGGIFTRLSPEDYKTGRL